MTLGILLVFLSSCFFGISNSYWKKAIGNKPFLPILFIRGLYSTMFFFICCLIDFYTGFFQHWLGIPPSFTLQEFGLSLLLCLFSTLGLYFFVKSIKDSEASLVIPLSSLNIFGLITAVFVLGETWRPTYTWALICVIIGIYLIYRNELQSHSSQSFWRALKGGLLASFFWGVSYTLFKYPIAWLGILRFSFLLEFSVSMLIGVLLWRSKDSLRSCEQGPIRFLAICLIGGSVFLHLSYQLTDFTKIIFAGKFQLIFSIITAKVLYDESIGWYRLAGIGFLFLSIYLIF